MIDLPYQAHSDTSREAAESMRETAASARGRVLRMIAGRGQFGATRYEIEQILVMSGNTVRPRVVELLKAGLVEETDQRRLTGTGRWAVVLRAKENGET